MKVMAGPLIRHSRAPARARAVAAAALAGLVAALALFAGAAAAGPGASKSVVGGAPTTVEDWPYQVALLRTDKGTTDFQRQFCAGAVLTPSLVITAAHCIKNQTPDLVAAQIEVLTGRTSLDSDEGERLNVTAIHEFGFDEDTQANDVVLLDLWPATTSAPRVKLPGRNEKTLWDAKGPAYVTGWGSTEEGGPRSNVLREAEVRMISDSRCRSDASYATLFLPRTMVCAGAWKGGVDSCQGDSGGPLSVPARHGEWRLAGTVSFGAGCARKHFPGIYSRLGGAALRDKLQGFVNGTADPVDISGSGGAMPCNPTIAGTEGDDRIKGTKGRDVIDGLGGRDVIFGRKGNDVICGDESGDAIFGGPGRDLLRGGRGPDLLRGGPGRDVVRGGPGRDREIQ